MFSPSSTLSPHIPTNIFKCAQLIHVARAVDSHYVMYIHIYNVIYVIVCLYFVVHKSGNTNGVYSHLKYPQDPRGIQSGMQCAFICVRISSWVRGGEGPTAREANARMRALRRVARVQASP